LTAILTATQVEIDIPAPFAIILIPPTGVPTPANLELPSLSLDDELQDRQAPSLNNEIGELSD
jgi:hypothetical protein